MAPFPRIERKLHSNERVMPRAPFRLTPSGVFGTKHAPAAFPRAEVARVTSTRNLELAKTETNERDKRTLRGAFTMALEEDYQFSVTVEGRVNGFGSSQAIAENAVLDVAEEIRLAGYKVTLVDFSNQHGDKWLAIQADF